jgi:hypothetical protein
MWKNDDEATMGQPPVKATQVKLSSFCDQISSEARTFEEAAMMQHKD